MTYTSFRLFPVCVTVDGTLVLKNWTRYIGGNSSQYVIRTTQSVPKRRYTSPNNSKEIRHTPSSANMLNALYSALIVSSVVNS